MPDATNGNNTVEETQPSAIPTENETAETKEAEDQLPEDASDRTREQFEKLKKHNEELAERLRQLEEDKKQPDVTESVFDNFRPQDVVPDVPIPTQTQFPGLSQKQIAETYEGLVDKDGYLNADLLKSTLKSLQDDARQAKEEARKTREEYKQREENEMVRQAHQEFPYLNPKSKSFDRGFFEAVKNELVSQMMRGEKDLVAAAKKVSQFYKVPTETKNEESSKKEEQIKQISALGSSTSRGSIKASIDDDAELIMRTRKGDTSALMERLKRAGQ